MRRTSITIAVAAALVCVSSGVGRVQANDKDGGWQELQQILSDALATPRPVSILELRGLGKEHWKDIEATRHVEDERAAWD